MFLFALDQSAGAQALSAQLAQALGLALAPCEVREFADGEFKVRPLLDPGGAHVWVCASLYGDATWSPGERLVRLAMFIGALRQHGAAQVTVLMPYLAFARKDRITQDWDPVTSRYVAQLLEAVGATQVLALEVHNVAAYHNAFRIPARHIPAHSAFDAVLAPWASDPWVVVAPDPGGVKRAQLWREHLEHRFARPVGFAMMDKRRSAGVMSSFDLLAGSVDQATALLLDDLIASGSTLQRAAVTLRAAGARQVLAFAAHGLFIEPAATQLGGPELDAVFVTDSIPAWRVPAASALARKLRVVPVAPVLAHAVRQATGLGLG